MSEEPRRCEECQRLAGIDRLWLCEGKECNMLVCIRCWNAHLATHLLISPDFQVVAGFANINQPKVQEALSLLGKQTNDS